MFWVVGRTVKRLVLADAVPILLQYAFTNTPALAMTLRLVIRNRSYLFFVFVGASYGYIGAKITDAFTGTGSTLDRTLRSHQNSHILTLLYSRVIPTLILASRPQERVPRI